ncbi:MAG: cyclodeaminase/cyclohydrolase family protein [Vicinamibacterales bacterium]
MPLTDASVRDLLTAFSSSDPTPGGGSAAALASAVGASLLMMVAGLPKTRNGSNEDRTALTASATTLADVRERLADAIDADSAAYDRVVAAYKMPKASADEQAVRKAAIEHALREATEVPLGVVRLSAAAIDQAGVVAAHGQRAAASDVGVAIALLRAGLRGARLNIESNVTGLSDADFTTAVATETTRCSDGASRAATEAEALL